MKTKTIYFLNSILAFSLVLIGMLLQHLYHLEPCPLCMLQRICFIALGILFLSSFLLQQTERVHKVGQQVLQAGQLGIAALGILFSGRQVWLQHFPPADGNECAASFSYMLQTLPFAEVMKKIFLGTAECSLNNWAFLGLGFAEWAILWFIYFSMIIFYLMRK